MLIICELFQKRSCLQTKSNNEAKVLLTVCKVSLINVSLSFSYLVLQKESQLGSLPFKIFLAVLSSGQVSSTLELE